MDYSGEVAAVAVVEDVVEIVAEGIDFAWESGGFSNCYSTEYTNLIVMVVVVVVAMGSMQ